MDVIGGFRSDLSQSRSQSPRAFWSAPRLRVLVLTRADQKAKGDWGAYHLARKSGNFGLKSNGKVIFRKFYSEIVEYLQR